MNQAVKLAYLDFLIELALTKEEELATLETYIDEGNFEVFAPTYFQMQSDLSHLYKEMNRIRKSLSMSKKNLNRMIYSKI